MKVSQLEHMIALIARVHNVHIELDRSAQGVRATVRSGRDISPRLTPKKLYEWLDAFEQGCTEYKLSHSARIS